MVDGPPGASMLPSGPVPQLRVDLRVQLISLSPLVAEAVRMVSVISVFQLLTYLPSRTSAININRVFPHRSPLPWRENSVPGGTHAGPDWQPCLQRAGVFGRGSCLSGSGPPTDSGPETGCKAGLGRGCFPPVPEMH